MSKILLHYDGKPVEIERRYWPSMPKDSDECPRCGADDWESRGEIEGYYIFRCRQCRYYARVQG